MNSVRLATVTETRIICRARRNMALEETPVVQYELRSSDYCHRYMYMSCTTVELYELHVMLVETREIKKV